MIYKWIKQRFLCDLLHKNTNFGNDFKAIIIVDNNTVSGKVIDLELNDEYLGIKTNMNGNFVSKVRDEYLNILLDIKNLL